MNLSEKMLRACLYCACDLRCEIDTAGWPTYLAAVAEIVHVHRLGPLLEYAHILDRAKRIEQELKQERARRIPELVELIRSTYPVQAAA